MEKISFMRRLSSSLIAVSYTHLPIVLSAAEGDKYGTGKKRMQGGALSDWRLSLIHIYKLSKYQTNILSRYSDGVVPVCLRKKRVIVEFD